MLKQSVIFLSYFLCIFSPHFYLFGRGIKKLPHTDSSFQMCTRAGAWLGQSQRLRTQSRLVYRIRGLYYLNRHQWPPRYTLGWTWTWVRHSNIEYEHFNQALNCCTNAHLHLQIILNTCLSKKEKICFEFEGRITWRGHTQRHLERDNKNNTRTHKGRGRERDSSIHWFTFTPQMARMTRLSEPKPRVWNYTRVSGAPALGPYCIAIPNTSKELDWAGADARMGCWQYKQWLNPLTHNKVCNTFLSFIYLWYLLFN